MNAKDYLDNRQIRIFISSTFRDMLDEREYLITKVFPTLRRYCEEREVSLIELDLRWGISEEEAKQGKVFDICLREVQRTKPFFIGLLGERYGWIPSETERKTMTENTSLYEDFPWIEKELVEEGTSITEIEMQSGALRAEEKTNAYFYIRSPKMETPPEFIDKPGSHDAKKLLALKQKLRAQNTYPVKDYESVEMLGAQVEADFKALVNELFPQTALTTLEKERLQQRNFLKSRTRVYVPNPEWDAKLDKFVAGADKALVITGKSGMGKSAFLAHWISSRLEKNNADEKLIYHFIGASQSGGDFHKITGHLIDEVRDLYHVPVKESTKPEVEEADTDEKDSKDKQKEELEDLLFTHARSGKLIIILEGIHRLFDGENAKLLNWLPSFPDNVKVIYSSEQSDTSMEVFERWGCKHLEIQAAPPASRQQMIRDYLKSFSKTLTTAQEARLAADEKCENPLVLLSILDELRVFGVHEKLNDQIGNCLDAPDNEGLFALILEHIEELYEDDKTHHSLVKDILSLLAVSRYGLAEKEILGISGVAPLYWSQLLNAMAGQLAIMNGYVSFTNRMIETAVKRLYLPNSEAEKPYRKRIASYMETNEQVPFNRKCDELPYQLFELKEWDKLHTLLLNIKAFLYIYEKDKFEAGKYWRSLREADKNRYTPAKYLELEKTVDEVNDFLSCCSKAMHLATDIWGDYHLSIKFTLKHEEAYRKEYGEDESVSACIWNNVGCSYLRLGEYDKALEYLEKALPVLKADPETKKPAATCYGNIGQYYFKLGDYKKALEYGENALAINKEILGGDHPNIASAYNQIGICHAQLGHNKEAIGYHEKALAIREAAFGKNNLTTSNSRYNIGICYFNTGDYQKSLEYLEDTLAIREAILGSMHPDIAAAYDSIGSVYLRLREKKKALEYLQKGLEMREAVLGKNHPDTALSYNNIAECYRKMWKPKKAFEYLEKALAIRQAVLGENVLTATSYNNIGTMYTDRRNFKKAVGYFEKALPILESVLGGKHSNTADACFHLAVCYYNLIENKKALAHFEKAFSMFIELGNEKEIKKCGEWISTVKDEAAGTEGIPAEKLKKWRAKNKKANFLCFLPFTRWIGCRMIAALAKEGYADGQFGYGIIFLNGVGVKEDEAKAFEWFRKAAEQGHPSAQDNLGYCYDRGKGTRGDYAKAFEWYRKSAEQGYDRAQYDLGTLFELGNGVEQDYKQAAEWYAKAAQQGLEKAQKRLDKLEDEGHI